jgi:hypothetical protein
MAINTDASGKEIVCYFKKPSRLVLGVALAELDRNIVLASEYIFDDCTIRDISDFDAFRNSDEIFLGLIPKLQTLARVKKSTFTTL